MIPGPRSAAIVGVGNTDYHALYRQHVLPRAAEGYGLAAFRDGLTDAGLTIEQIDGLITSGSDSFAYLPFAQRAGLRNVRFAAAYPLSGRMCTVALGHASMIVEAGLADYVALIYSTDQRSSHQRYGADVGGSGGSMYDKAFGIDSPGALYSMAYSRYLDQHGYRGREHLLAAVPIASRRHAALNPKAVMQTPLSTSDYLAARYIARPLRLFDYCLPSDGAVCLIVTTLERARNLRKPPVTLVAPVHRASMCEWLVPEDRWYATCKALSESLLNPLGLGRADLSSLAVYDNFSVAVLWALEGLGYCGAGEALEWVQGGRVEIGGELPINTSGGMLSEAFMQGWNLHAEAVRQLRGDAGERQLAACQAILYICLAHVSGASLMMRAD